MIKEFLPNGDTGEIIDGHYQLNEFGEVIDHIEKMPKLDTVIKNYSQYTDVKYNQGCTIMSSINAIASISNYDFTPEDISSVYEQAVEDGYVYGKAWSRYYGVNSVRKWRNKRFPNNTISTFVVQIFSDEWNMVMEKLGTAVVSLMVDSAYRTDVKLDLSLDKDGPFVCSVGHATCFRNNGGIFYCDDSVPQNKKKDPNTPMTYKVGNKVKLDFLIGFKNLRSDCHIILMDNRLKAMDEEEIERLEKVKEALNRAIQANSDIWNLTTQEAERKIRKDMNDVNRAKLKIIENMLN